MGPFCLFLVSVTAYTGYRAVAEKDLASRQHTSFGIIGSCEGRGRAHQNYCSYTFPVGEEQYRGVNKASPGVGFGWTVVVYYDSGDPGISALEDYSEQSRKDARFFYILLLVLALTGAFVIWNSEP